MNRASLAAGAVFLVLSTSVLTFLALQGGPASAGSPHWAIDARIAETCSCDPACPCIFGSEKTREHCEGTRLVEIESGHFEGVRLDGVSVVIGFRLGEWAGYYVTDDATDEQVAAAGKLISAAFPSFENWGVEAIEKVPVSVERTATTVKYTSPASTAEIKVMEGMKGKPVRVENLPAAFLEGYTQYVSVENSHDGGGHEFHYSGTNGFTSRIKSGNE